MFAPRLRVFIAASVDGHIAAPDGGLDWLEPFQAEDFGYADFLAGIGTIVMGRNSFDQVMGMGDWPYAGKTTVVMTSREMAATPPDTKAFCGPAEVLADYLRARRDGGDVWINGGSQTIRAFLDADLIDRLEIFTMPVLLGDGIPLFARSPVRARLRLRETQACALGVVKSTYERG
ncbi:MAG: dihydrofolate reductase family protein [Pseudomonadota bacterium]